ncbi:hypothetical protein V1509DRAFT_626378 [Lipomyces kononenkoae]
MLLSRIVHQTAKACCSVLDDNDTERIHIPKGPAFVLFVTAAVFAVVIFVLNYVSIVVLTLAAVEDPNERYSSLANESSQPLVGEDDNDVADEAQLEADGIGRNTTYSPKGSFVTSSIRRTITYLRDEAGSWGPFRGLSAYIVMQLISWLYVNFVASLGPILWRPLFYLVLFVGLAPFSLVLTHIIVTVPTQRTWFMRLRNTPFRLSKLTLPVIATEYIAGQVAYFPSFIIVASVLPYIGHGGWGTLFGSLAALFAVALAFLLFLFLSLPTTIARIRIQASLLPEDEEQIITFDREAFGTITTVRDAMQFLVNNLKTFSSFDRKRIFKLILKFTIIVAAVSILFLSLLAGEMVWMVNENPDIGKYLQDVFNGQS